MCMNSSVGRWCQRLTSPAGASGFTGDTGATGQTGVTGGWTLPPSHDAESRVNSWRCVISASDGCFALMRRPLQALAASRATRVPPVSRVSQVGGHFHHHMKPNHESFLGSVLSPQLMGNPLSLRHSLQALAASQARREPPVRRVSRVCGHSRPCMI